MKPRLLMLMSLAALLLAGGSSPAVLKSADAAHAASPALVLQVKSVDELLVSLNTAAKNFLPRPALENLERDALSKLDLNKIKGVDPKKPFGLYATISDGLLRGDFFKTSIVVLVPVSDKKAFVDLLGKIGLRPEKQREEEYVITIPNVPVPASLRFLKGYAYICVARAKMDASAFLDPHELFSDKETAAAVLHVRMDRLPDDLRQYLTNFIRNMEQKIEILQKLRGPTEGPPTPRLVRMETTVGMMRWGVGWLKLLVNGAKELIFRVDFDPKTGVIGSEMALEPRSGSDLAKSIGELPPTKNDFAGIVAADSAAHLLIQAPLFIGELKEMLARASLLIGHGADNGSKEDAPKGSAEAVCEATKALSRTLNEGNLDFAVSMRGPDRNDQFTVVGAFNLKDTAALEKALRTTAKSVQEVEVDMIKVDAFTVEGISVHEIAVGKRLPPDAQKVFGQSSVYLGLSPDAVFVTFGPQGKAVITEVLTGKLGSKSAPLLQVEISGKRILALFKTLGAPQDALQSIEKLTAERSTVMAIKVKGGDKLVVRVEFGLPALWVLSPKAVKRESKEAQTNGLATPPENK